MSINRKEFVNPILTRFYLAEDICKRYIQLHSFVPPQIYVNLNKHKGTTIAYWHRRLYFATLEARWHANSINLPTTLSSKSGGAICCRTLLRRSETLPHSRNGGSDIDRSFALPTTRQNNRALHARLVDRRNIYNLWCEMYSIPYLFSTFKLSVSPKIYWIMPAKHRLFFIQSLIYL